MTESKISQEGRRIPRRYRTDIMAMERVYGNLEAVKDHIIHATLKEFGKICERDQLKIAAYKGLNSYIQKHYGLTLHLTSQKTRM